MNKEKYPGIPEIKVEVGRKYKFTIPKMGKGTIERKFEGQVIQITRRFVTLKHTLGFNESFLKVDLIQFNYQEV